MRFWDRASPARRQTADSIRPASSAAQIERIDRRTIAAEFHREDRTPRPGDSQRRALHDLVANARGHAAKIGDERGPAAGMLDDDDGAIATVGPGKGNPAIGGGYDLRSARGGERDPGGQAPGGSPARP